MKKNTRTGGMLYAANRFAATAAITTLVTASAARADITYSLCFDPASSPEAQQVANSVTVAALYNQQGSFNKHRNVSQTHGIHNAEARADGDTGNGGTPGERVTFHEAAHTPRKGAWVQH